RPRSPLDFSTRAALVAALGYGVIGSRTGSGPVSLGSSPGTPAEADQRVQWPLRGPFSRLARSVHPGDDPPDPLSGTLSCSTGRRWPSSLGFGLPAFIEGLWF